MWNSFLKERINKSLVTNLNPADSGSYFCWDTELTGFGVRVTRNGVKTFVLKITVNGKRPLQKIGVFPGVSLEVAKAEAKRRIGVIASGGDPIAEKTRKRLESVTLEQGFADYVRLRELKPSTIHGMETELKNTFCEWRKRN